MGSPVEGGQQEVQIAVGDLPFLLQIVQRVQHALQGGHLAEQRVVGGVLGDGTVKHLIGGGVGVNDPALLGEGHHAVGHVEEQGVQLIALVFHLPDGVPELPGHVVEGVGQHADLVPGADLDAVGEVALGHPHGPLGEALDGGDHGFGQQKGQQDGDHQTKAQRLHNQHENLVHQIGQHGGVVQNVDDIGGVPPLEGQGHIHVPGGDAAFVAVLPPEGGGEVGGENQILPAVVGAAAAGQHLAAGAVEDVEFTDASSTARPFSGL